MSESYANLKRILDFDTDVFDSILTDMLSPDELRLIGAFERAPFTDAQAAGLLRLPLEAARSLLERSYLSGAIDKVPENGPSTYAAADMYSILGVFVLKRQDMWRSYPDELIAALDAWFLGRYRRRIEARMAGSADRPSEKVIPLEDAIEFVKGFPHDIYVYPCDCRTIFNRISGCEHLVDVCLCTSRAEPNSYPHRGIGRKITVEEAVEIVRQTDKDGLIHSPAGDYHLCNCCVDCCYPFRCAQALGSIGDWPKVFYVARIDPEACVGCGLCARRCPRKAIALIDKKAIINQELCIGCGVCRVPCKKGAISMCNLDHPANTR